MMLTLLRFSPQAKNSFRFGMHRYCTSNSLGSAFNSCDFPMWESIF